MTENLIELARRTGSDTYGALFKYAYESELEFRYCPGDLFPLILVLRMLLEDRFKVFYKTNWRYDRSDSCMSSTMIYLHDPAGRYRSATLDAIAEIVFDEAAEVRWEFPDPDAWSSEGWSSDSSHGTIQMARVEGPMSGGGYGHGVSATLALLHLAASEGGKRLVTEELEKGVMRLSAEELNTGERTPIGFLRWISHGNSNHYGNCVLQLL
ncbi:MAG TPA: hypothetical protein VFZ48_01865 [Candidatus Saccharimonadales bacterium]